VKRNIASLILLGGLIIPAASAAEKASHWRAVWHVSQALLAGANAADAASSWGKYEENPLLRTGTRFSYGSVSIKMGIVAGCLTMQHFMVHKNPKSVRLYSIGNLAASAALGAVAARNMHVPEEK